MIRCIFVLNDNMSINTKGNTRYILDFPDKSSYSRLINPDKTDNETRLIHMMMNSLYVPPKIRFKKTVFFLSFVARLEVLVRLVAFTLLRIVGPPSPRPSGHSPLPHGYIPS